jgi:hypothetical protein
MAGAVEATGGGGLRSAHITAHTAAPSRRCLECARQYNPAEVQAEREGWRDDPRYIEGLPDDHGMKRNENVFPFSMSCASFELAQFVRLIVAPAGCADTGSDDYQYVLGTLKTGEGRCTPTCLYSGVLQGSGDQATITVTAPHAVAERARSCGNRPPKLTLPNGAASPVPGVGSGAAAGVDASRGWVVNVGALAAIGPLRR